MMSTSPPGLAREPPLDSVSYFLFPTALGLRARSQGIDDDLEESQGGKSLCPQVTPQKTFVLETHRVSPSGLIRNTPQWTHSK